MDSLELQFIHQEILKGLRDIFSVQRDIAQHRIYLDGRERRVLQGSGRTVQGRSGRLMESLNNPSFQVWKGNLGVHAHIDYPIYIRFLDMKKHGNYMIYNRQIWGIFYGEVFPNIRYEYSDWLRSFTERLISETYQQ